jgi:toxin ParE1/3/4
MTIVLSKKAYDDLDSIETYLATLSPEAAEETISYIQEAVTRLGDFPALRAKIDETGLRRLIVSGTPYVIFYRAFLDHVNIRAIFHASQRRFLE